MGLPAQGERDSGRKVFRRFAEEFDAASEMLYSSNRQPMDIDRDEISLLNSLRERDEAAFTQLVERYHASLVRLARTFVRDTAIAEEVAQETWLAVLDGLDRFEGRSSLRTWIFTILTNKARTSGQRESRTLSYSDMEEALRSEPTVDPGRFQDAAAGSGADHWRAGAAPASWEGIPEEVLLSQESMELIRRVIAALPDYQRLVITLHDVDHFSAQEICNILKISETNQRVLLHRARAKVREGLEGYLQAEL
jgi:RNA polymerase sigma-70 factor, ECF subfamily